MRKACRQCGYHWFWHLGDGRYKCRQCGQRQSFRSVWEASRLDEANKRRLLEYFVLGVPAQRLRFRGPVSPEASARFFRLIRQVLAHEEACEQPFEPLALWPAALPKVVVFTICQVDSRLRFYPLDDRQLKLSHPFYNPTTALGQIAYGGAGQAYIALGVRGKQVILGGEATKGKTNAPSLDEVSAAFWHYAQQWLAARREVPLKFLHLYLAETLFRFNHQEQDIFPLIYKAMKGTNSAELRS